MSHEAVQSCVSEVVPCTHLAWPTGKSPSLPWATFILDDSASMYADNRKFARVNNWAVELLEESRDADVEGRLEAAINEAFGPCEITEAWVNSEQCIQVTFRFTEIEKEANNGY